jgi:Glycosyl hydrolase catalytic core
MRRKPPVGLGLGALFAALTFLTLAAHAGAVPRSFYGIVPQTTPSEKEFARLGAGRVGAYRWAMGRRGIDGPDGTYAWAGTDQLITELATNGIKPVPFVTGHDNGSGYREFLRAAVDRYGPDGAFWTEHPELPPDPIEDWQIGNEVNSSTFNGHGPQPRSYVRHLKVASETIHARDPHAYILFAGMFGTPHPDNGSGMAAWQFLNKAYQAGAKKYFDAAAPHPYGRSIGDVRRQIGKFRHVMHRHHDGGADIWVTELGWSSKRNISSFLGRGKQGQARMLKRSFRLLKRKQHSWNVRGVMWFTLADHHDPTFCTWCDSAGLFNKHFHPKPAWKQYVKLTGGKR